MLSCHEATRLLSEAQEQELGFQKRLPLQMHLLMCSGCRNFGKQMQVLRQLARAYAQGADERKDKPDGAAD